MKKQKTFHGRKVNKVVTALLISLNLLFLSGQWMTAQAQQKIRVIGKVSDASGESIIGASVVQKGSTIGTITDMNGNFVLSVASESTLQISYIGYITQDIKAISGRPLSIVLKEDTKTLDEVVVVGFGTQKKVNLTGSVGLVAAKELESRPVTNLTQALQGLVPGLQISVTSGQLDKSASINIRGAGTIGDGSSGSPLVLIDGMEGDMNSINMQDVANISVLKDAAASSIYGSRAPFGVILITTKKGVSGKPVINYNNSFRFGQAIRTPDPMDSYTFATFFNDGAKNAGRGVIFNDDTMQKMKDYQSGVLSDNGMYAGSNGKWFGSDDPYTHGYANTNWYDVFYKDWAFSQEHNFSATGGSEKVNYYASFNYLDQSGLLKIAKDDLKRYNINAKISAELASWARFNYSIRFTREDYERPTNLTDGGLYEKLGRQTWPNLPVYDQNGYFFSAPTPTLAIAEGGNRNVQTDNTYHQAALILEPVKNWITHVEFNYHVKEADVAEINLPTYNHDVAGNLLTGTGNSSAHRDFLKENYTNWNVYSEYSRSLKEDHHFKAMLGFQAEELDQSLFGVTKYGLLLPSMPEIDLTTGLDGSGKAHTTDANGERNSWSTAGFFGRLNYDYKGRYLAEVNMRYDGTSRFREDQRWKWFPSFSLGWNIAREEFWKSLSPVIGTLKLRGSYGKLGNQNTNSWYQTYSTIGITPSGGTWLQDGVKPNIAAQPGLISALLTWEQVRTWNVGLDFGLFNNRLTGSFDTYIRYTDNMVGPASELPIVLGITVPKTNNSDLKTAGWELELGWNDRLKDGFGYSAKFTLADARTMIRNYPGNPTNAISTYISGQYTGQIWGFETKGIAKTQEEMDAHLAAVGGQSAIGSSWAAGDVMYKDLDGEAGITKGAQTITDHGDLKVIGNSTPRYLFGLDLSADWKGFDFRTFFQGVAKRDYWQGSLVFWGATDTEWWSTGLKQHADYFRATASNDLPANLDAYYPRPILNSTTSKNHQTQSRYLQDASYIRLKNIQLGYTIPSVWTKRAKIEKCRVFVSGENLFTMTNLSDLFDPETISSGVSSGDSRIQNGGNAYPLSKTVSFGVSLTF
ncbi:TonB-dependent receptor [uncultured Bacteroides sp.]|uniref:SusC/RagA family TonB-linked outer membrane protein n=1 Tax=uncultured Bacteroides sp. TaxID=162156 RepID=UPI002AA8CB51|nr:TonB-dependent receptor [uncultured Bacteroides sp.]